MLCNRVPGLWNRGCKWMVFEGEGGMLPQQYFAHGVRFSAVGSTGMPSATEMGCEHRFSSQMSQNVALGTLYCPTPFSPTAIKYCSVTASYRQLSVNWPLIRCLNQKGPESSSVFCF